MMISTPAITEELSRLLGGEVRSSVAGNRLALLTPVDYPDREGVVVYVEQDDGTVRVSDLGITDAKLIGEVNEREATAAAATVARRYDVEVDRGTIVATAPLSRAADACWRVAQAAAMIAAASLYLRPQQASSGESFRDAVGAVLPSDRVERNRRLSGASGHAHRVSFYVPETETVIEPVGGRQAWQAATRVYAQFGDLSQVNGYRFQAIVDDRDDPAAAEDEARLLVQVGRVVRWSEREHWLPRLLDA